MGGGGFSRTKTLDVPTNATNKLYQVCKDRFKANYKNEIVRNVHIGIIYRTPKQFSLTYLKIT
ncbi:DinB/UmuC family translesion DNA polymerase [Paenibacillus plantarum]|uniref:DinB/UmuC family translesion DNA polymerase n=1 Tax=Paenibacillus plantarum TaxID=2654975 RepID=UPI0035E44ACE